MERKFKYDEIATLKKSNGVYVKVGIKFDSKCCNPRRNPSGVSYYIEGYDLRDWCYQEELKRTNFISRFFFRLFKISRKFKNSQFN